MNLWISTNHSEVHKLKRLDSSVLEYVSCEELRAPSDVWRVAWNIVGSTLVTSAEDGSISLWKKNFEGTWVNTQTLSSKSQAKIIFNVVN